jgi:hypothetical protein
VKCVLDIGLQKTGSKARQQFFMSELHRVIGLRVLYPSAGREAGWHCPLSKALTKGDRSLLNAVLREAEEQESLADLLILSYEDLYKLKEAQIHWLKDSLPDLTAVVFLRRQDQLINSLHNQLYKSHRITQRKLEDFEDHMLDHNINYDHRSTLERWTGVLGRESVVPILFDKTVSSVLTFLRAVNIDVNLDGYEDTYPNRAIDSFGLAVLRWVKRLVQDEQELPIIMNEAHCTLAPYFVALGDEEEYYSLTLEMRHRIMSHYEASNEWVRRGFFPERRSLFPPLDLGVLSQPDYSVGRELAEEIIAAARTRVGSRSVL